MLGVLLVNKPLGLTSHDAVNRVRRRLGTKRVGHAGTLDPLATGLLVIAVGPATRFLQYLPLEPKLYETEITFGVETSTYDKEGEIIREAPVPADLQAAIDEVKGQFLGLIQQLPPMYSAVKVGGQPLYKHARAGNEIERELRNVHIGRFDIQAIDERRAIATIECSGGTYIRTLGHDLGQKLGCGAHLSKLVRTEVGRFRLDQAHELEHFDTSSLYSLKDSLAPMPMMQLDVEQTRNVREGRQIAMEEQYDSKLVALLEPGGTVFSIARVVENRLQPECVIPAEAGYDAV